MVKSLGPDRVSNNRLCVNATNDATGVTGPDAVEAAPAPAEFVAVTVNV